MEALFSGIHISHSYLAFFPKYLLSSKLRFSAGLGGGGSGYSRGKQLVHHLAISPTLLFIVQTLTTV